MSEKLLIDLDALEQCGHKKLVNIIYKFLLKLLINKYFIYYYLYYILF